MSFDARDFFVRFVTAVNGHDFESLEPLVHQDFVARFPQSGEQARGFAAFVAQLRGYPGLGERTPQISDTELVGDGDRWAMTPAYTVVPLSSPNEYTTLGRTQYPDGSWWWVLGICELRDERLYRLENYFAPELPAPLAESIARYSGGPEA